jgi:hypothetical protein
VAESLPVPLAGRIAGPVIQHRRRRAEDTHRFVLILPFGEGEVRVELEPKDYAALTREMVRFWNEQGEAASKPPQPLKEGGRSLMAHWLIKSEPSKWSWDEQVKAGAKGTHWDGVKNHTAKLNLMAMKQGDQVFFYHSNEGLEVVGIVEVIKEAYNWIPGEPWVLVDFKAVKPLPKPVTLGRQGRAETCQDGACHLVPPLGPAGDG